MLATNLFCGGLVGMLFRDANGNRCDLAEPLLAGASHHQFQAVWKFYHTRT